MLKQYENGKSAYAERHPWIVNMGGYLIDSTRNSGRREGKEENKL